MKMRNIRHFGRVYQLQMLWQDMKCIIMPDIVTL